MSELYKVIVIGDPGVGKSALVSRLKAPIGDLPDLRPTIGMDTTSFSCTLPATAISNDDNAPGPRITLSIWDTAGQERFRSLTAGFYRNAAAIVFVYDMTNGGSFSSLASAWLGEADLYGPANAVRVLVGNKHDLTQQSDTHEWREVSLAESRAFAKRHGMLAYECSAKCDGPAIQQLFEDIALSIWSRPMIIPSRKLVAVAAAADNTVGPGTFACCS